MMSTENLLTFMYMYVDYLTWNKVGFAITLLQLDDFLVCSDVTGQPIDAWPHLESVLQLDNLLVCSDVTSQRVDADVVNLLLQQLLVAL